ncbi:hypothetical protein [Flavobacterium cerinum]|uniref:Uncharacterized protein n=1 Tax=Flavobacterium cerinum TaxID=2502784 RepID=A0A444GLA8_9FLAO|nr:hypothetical protein [Flavobacterium cerinum]RWW91799.1 hypothetical protein EPI11_18120 [Flavobacterium cerinum]
MKAKLNEVNWFENIGKPLEEGMFTIPVKAVNSNVECLKHNNSLNWGNFILYARNRLSWYIQSFHKEESRKWNEISAKARLDYKCCEPIIIEWADKNNVNKDLLASLKSIIISHYIEQHYFDHLDKNIPKQFDVIMNVYKSGHIPCGWDGSLPKNEGYDAIDFNTGKLLIW